MRIKESAWGAKYLAPIFHCPLITNLKVKEEVIEDTNSLTEEKETL